MKVLSYKADLYTLFCMIGFSILMLGPFFIPLEMKFWPLWLLASLHFSFCVNLINHNHAHVPTFRVQWANDLFDYWLTLLRGGSAVFIKIIHNINHHQHVGTPNDWFFSQNGHSPLSYILTTVKRFREGAKPFYSKMGSNFLRKQKIERVLLVLFILALVLLSFKKFLVFVLVPWIFGNFFLVYTNYIFHHKAEEMDDFNNSYNFTNTLENLLYFNGGYHTIHHLNPSLHWSELKAKHEIQIAPKIKPALMVNSMFVHAFHMRKHQ